MDRQQLFVDLAEARPAGGDVVYVERRGEDYAWNLTAPGQDLVLGGIGAAFPDVWVYWSGEWPVDDAARQHAVFDDLLEEMESMGGGSDRCRWPLDEPWPHAH